MPFGIRDTDRPTFSGYGLGSPLKYDRGGFLIDLLESHKDPIHWCKIGGGSHLQRVIGAVSPAGKSSIPLLTVPFSPLMLFSNSCSHSLYAAVFVYLSLMADDNPLWDDGERRAQSLHLYCLLCEIPDCLICVTSSWELQIPLFLMTFPSFKAYIVIFEREKRIDESLAGGGWGG